MKTTIVALIIAALFVTSNGPHPAAPETLPAAPETVNGFVVQTDYSGLTPYAPPPETSTRLSPGPMPELMPSGSYGPLVPYIGSQVFTEYGDVYYKYGLATLGGVLVTDAVYEWVYLSSAQIGEQSAYILTAASTDGYGELRYGACAPDGRWSLPLDYDSIILHESVILATRSYGADGYTPYNIDVYDYTGKLLYNMLDMPYVHELDQGESYSSMNAPSDLVVTRLVSGEAAYIDLKTGGIRITDFENARQFSDGLSAMCAGGRWGYIDEDFRIVIDLQYLWANDFIDGQAVVMRENGTMNDIISKDGSVLFSVEGYDETMELYNQYDGKGYVLRKLDESVTTYYTQNYQNVPAVIEGCEVWYQGDGWYVCCLPDSVVLISPKGEWYELPGVKYVSGIYDSLVACADAFNNYGVMTLDGKAVIPFSEDYHHIYKLTNHNLFCAYTDSGVSFFRPDGSVFVSASGFPGVLDTKLGLLGLTNRDSFYYLDENGDVAFRVSLRGYVPD